MKTLLRSLTAVAATSLMLTASLAPSAGAAEKIITVKDMKFIDGRQTVAQGTTVKWVFADAPQAHTTTSDQGFWDSPDLLDDAYSVKFENAGKYPYHCSIHSHMRGEISVPLYTPHLVGGGFFIRWSSASSTPDGTSYDVQIKRPGAKNWKAYRNGTKTRGVNFNPAKKGLYRFRARTHVGTHISGWSKAKRLNL